MCKSYAFVVDQKEFGTVRLGKHEFSATELIEMTLRLLGYTRKPKDILDFKNNIREKQNDDQFFEDFETDATFDFEWIKSGKYKISDISNTDTIISILEKGKSSDSLKGEVLKQLDAVKAKIVGFNHPKEKELLDIIKEYSKDPLLGRMASEGITTDLENPKPVLKGLLEKLKTVNESAKVAVLVEAQPDKPHEVAKPLPATNSDKPQEAIKPEEKPVVDTPKKMEFEIEKEIPLPELPIVKFTRALTNPVVYTNMVGQQPPQEPINCVPMNVLKIVNVNTLSGVTEDTKGRVFEILGRAFNSQNLLGYIYQIQSAPLFVFINTAKAPEEFVIQSIQPGCPMITLRLTPKTVECI